MSTTAQRGSAQLSPASPVSPPVPLRRNLPFQALWIGTSASTLGVCVADVAYPLAILASTGSPARAGLFASVQAIGMLAAGLPSGSLADRFDTRTIVLAAEACRAAVTGIVVIALISGWLSFPLLLAAAVLLGAGQAVCTTARMLLLRSVVPAEQLNGALAQDEVRLHGAAIAGPALGGALYAVRALAHAAPFLFAAGSFVVSLVTAALLRLLPVAGIEPPGARPAGPAPAGMFAGLRTLCSHPVLRAALLLIMIVNTLGAGLDLVVIVLLRHQAVPASEIGLALGIGSAGGIAGIPLIKVLHRLRPGVLLLAFSTLLMPVFALLALPFGPWWAAGLLFTGFLGVPACKVALDILVVRQAPAAERGRVVAAGMTLIGLGTPAGLAGCGLLLQYLPAQAAMLTLAATLAVGLAYCASSHDLRHTSWPG
jgi:predicted MFS family arabinose efflux permease